MNKTPDYSVVMLEIAEKHAEAVEEWLIADWGLAPVVLSKPNSDRCWIELYIEDELKACLIQRALEGGKHILHTGVRCCRARDWQSFWKHHFKQMRVGRRWVICPAWEKPELREGDRCIIVNPGLSFGTGNNFTTRFCLEALEWWVEKEGVPGSLLDAGTGSGILSVGAALLGVPKITAFDHDSQCIEQAKLNIQLNGLDQSCFDFKKMDICETFPHGAYDVICANIYADILIRASGAIHSHARRAVIVSGIRSSEADGVSEVYRCLGAREILFDGDGEWCGFVFSME